MFPPNPKKIKIEKKLSKMFVLLLVRLFWFYAEFIQLHKGIYTIQLHKGIQTFMFFLNGNAIERVLIKDVGDFNLTFYFKKNLMF